MFLFCVSYYDVHSDVILPPARGLSLYDIDVSSITYADDTVLLSTTIQNLQHMLNNIYQYGQKWHFRYSASKSVCMTFGESRQSHTRNKSRRAWSLGGITLQEVDDTKHLGVQLNACKNTIKRTKELSRRAYAHLGNLRSVGFHEAGLSPLTCATIWKRICIPSMLYACETWDFISVTELQILERAQRAVAKHIQGITRRTHNEIAIGLLGWNTIEGTIETAKLLFLQKLISIPPPSITKEIFLHQAYVYIMSNSIPTNSITSSLFQVLSKYDLEHFLMCYLKGSEFPNKIEWKSIIKKAVEVKEQTKWQEGLMRKEAYRFARIQTELQPNRLYSVMKRNLGSRSILLLMIQMLTVFEDDEDMQCSLCGNILTDSIEHIMMRCEGLIEERTLLWDKIMDSISVNAEADIMQRTDRDVLDILFGKEWAHLNIDNMDSFYISVAEYIKLVTVKLGI